MNSLIYLLVVVGALGVAHGNILPIRPRHCMTVMCTMDMKICPSGAPAPVPVGGCCPSLSACKELDKGTKDCSTTFCTMDLKICPDGKPAPVPAGECCPSFKACGEHKNPVKDCSTAFCTMDFKICPDGTPAPVPVDECCPSYKACGEILIARRSTLPSIGSLFSGENLLSTLSGATKGTNLGTALSIMKLLNNINQLSNDVHKIPALINQTLGAIVSGTGQAGQAVVEQLMNAAIPKPTGRSLFDSIVGGLGQNGNLLSSVTHLLPQGTSITTVLSLLNLLNNVNHLNNDIHQIPLLINQTLGNVVAGTDQASQVLLQQLTSLLGQSKPTGRNLFDSIGGTHGQQNGNILSSITHLLPQGTSITTVLSLLNLLNNVNHLNKDIHQIPTLINQTLANILQGTGQASDVVLQQLMSLVNAAKPNGRSLLGALGQNSNLLSTLSHALPQGTSITTVLSLLNLLNNAHALNNDLQQIPVVLQETLQNLLNGVQQLLPPTIQPV